MRAKGGNHGGRLLCVRHVASVVNQDEPSMCGQARPVRDSDDTILRGRDDKQRRRQRAEGAGLDSEGGGAHRPSDRGERVLGAVKPARFQDALGQFTRSEGGIGEELREYAREIAGAPRGEKTIKVSGIEAPARKTRSAD